MKILINLLTALLFSFNCISANLDKSNDYRGYFSAILEALGMSSVPNIDLANRKIRAMGETKHYNSGDIIFHQGQESTNYM